MRLLKSISIYTVANISKQGISFFLLPIITTYLSTSQNGDLSTINALVALIAPLMMVSFHSAINLEYFRKDHGEGNFSGYLSSGLSIPLLGFGFWLLVFGLFGNWIANWLDIKLIWVYAVPVLALFTVIPNLTSVIFQAFQDPIKYSLYNICMTVLELSLALVFIVLFLWNWEGRLGAILVSRVLFTLVGVYLLYKAGLFSLKIKKEYIRSALIFGIPLLPHALGGIVMDVSDRLFIREMISAEELGVYDIGYKIGGIIALVQVSVTLGWNPFLFERLKKPEKDTNIQLVFFSYLLMALLIISAFGLTLVAPLIFHWFIGENFAGGLQYVFWVALAYAFLGCYKVVAGYIFYQKRTLLLSYLAVFNIIVNLGLNYFFILEFGAIGATYATALSFFLFFVVVFIISYKINPLPWWDFKALYVFGKEKIGRTWRGNI